MGFGSKVREACIPDVVGGEFDIPHLKRFFVNAYVNLVPDAAIWAAMFADVPLAFSFRFNACAINEEVQWPRGTAIREAHFQCFYRSKAP